MPEPTETTELLQRLSDGDPRAADQLMPLVYEELRRVARHFVGDAAARHTLQPTALVHEAWVRLVDRDDPAWSNRDHFVGVAAKAMRSILIDHARARKAAKRGGGMERVPLDYVVEHYEEQSVDLVALDEALGKLAGESERAARLVELRFFGGMTAEEAARLLGISVRTAEREWRTCKAWLQAEMGAA